MLTDTQIRQAIETDEIRVTPFEEACLQPANYDFRMGAAAFMSSAKEKVDLPRHRVLAIEPANSSSSRHLRTLDLSPSFAVQLAPSGETHAGRRGEIPATCWSRVPAYPEVADMIPGCVMDVHGGSWM